VKAALNSCDRIVVRSRSRRMERRGRSFLERMPPTGERSDHPSDARGLPESPMQAGIANPTRSSVVDATNANGWVSMTVRSWCCRGFVLLVRLHVFRQRLVPAVSREGRRRRLIQPCQVAAARLVFLYPLLAERCGLTDVDGTRYADLLPLDLE
jgi:hypothetical protein